MRSHATARQVVVPLLVKAAVVGALTGTHAPTGVAATASRLGGADPRADVAGGTDHARE